MAKFELIVTSSKKGQWSETFSSKNDGIKLFNNVKSVSDVTLFEYISGKRLVIKSARNA